MGCQIERGEAVFDRAAGRGVDACEQVGNTRQWDQRDCIGEQ